jgi:hypothetical protein
MKVGKKVVFHGAFKSKADAEKKERQVGGFIRPSTMRGSRRFVVMSEKPAGAQRKKVPGPGRRPNPGVQIYKPTRGVEIAGMQKPKGHPCDAKCAAAGHKYRHRFKDPVEVIGLANGDVLLKRKS